MITLGLRLRDLGSRGFTWRDLRVIVEHLPVTSALARALDPDAGLGEPMVQLLAYNADMSALSFWAQTEDGSKGRNRPTPVLEQLTRAPAEGVGDLGDPEVVAALDAFYSQPRTA